MLGHRVLLLRFRSASSAESGILSPFGRAKLEASALGRTPNHPPSQRQLDSGGQVVAYTLASACVSQVASAPFGAATPWKTPKGPRVEMQCKLKHQEALQMSARADPGFPVHNTCAGNALFARSRSRSTRCCQRTAEDWAPR